jgi:hypothetical protein
MQETGNEAAMGQSLAQRGGIPTVVSGGLAGTERAGCRQ